MTTQLPLSIYDIPLKSSDGHRDNILSAFKGKVTLIFNCAAGCGNIPQHLVLEELNQRYKDEPDFNILAVTVDDFTCHGYEEFQNGLASYINVNNLSLTPGEVAQKYAVDNFGVTYEFSELTNGRYDKHRYDPTFLPGSVKEQDMHPLWFYLTGAYEADVGANGLPIHSETIPWSEVLKIEQESDKKTFTPLTGNFDKFLIDRTGTRIRRYANSFLLGERDKFGNAFPWVTLKEIKPGVPEYRPNTAEKDGGPDNNGPFPTALQRKGINVSLDEIARDIDEFLASW